MIPEWERQDAVLIAWPHAESDWARILPEIEACYIEIARTILRYEPLIVLSTDPDRVVRLVGQEHNHRLLPVEIDYNDTWCRDYAPIAFRVSLDDGPEIKALSDFTFNGWGMKFASDKDNLVSRCLYLGRTFADDVEIFNRLLLVLEGGSLESDGRGTILTTYDCIYEPNRNPGFDEEELRAMLTEALGAERLLMLRNGELEGDDTDGHVDTLARFISDRAIAYVCCEDTTDAHYHALKRMEGELRELRNADGEPYELIPLPLPKPIYEDDGHRLPATYANFLFVNGALLVPTYADEADAPVLERLRRALPDREVVGIDCRTLIRQHGSLHCATMQLPEGFVNFNKWN